MDANASHIAVSVAALALRSLKHVQLQRTGQFFAALHET